MHNKTHAWVGPHNFCPESGTCSVAVSQEFLNWGHFPLPEFRNWARLGWAGPMVPHFLPTLSVRLGAGFAGLGWADSHFSGPHRCGLKMDRFRLSDYASARAGPGRLFNTPLGVA